MRPFDMGAAFGVQSQQRAQRDALARAGFTDQGHGFTARHAEIDAIDGADRLLPPLKVTRRSRTETIGALSAREAVFMSAPLMMRGPQRRPRRRGNGRCRARGSGRRFRAAAGFSRLGTRCEQTASASGQRV